MKESVEKRMKLIRDAETPDDLRKHLCPFFEKGGHPDCIACRRTESDLDECRDYYLERIALAPMDIWTEEFDKFLVQKRDKVDLGGTPTNQRPQWSLWIFLSMCSMSV